MLSYRHSQIHFISFGRCASSLQPCSGQHVYVLAAQFDGVVGYLACNAVLINDWQADLQLCSNAQHVFCGAGSKGESTQRLSIKLVSSAEGRHILLMDLAFRPC